MLCRRSVPLLSPVTMVTHVTMVVLLLLHVGHTVEFTDDYVHTPGLCMMQGFCGTGRPCTHVNGIEPIVPDTAHLELLHRTCPMYADYSSVCCDVEQLHDFNSQLSIVKTIIGACEACLWNFKKIQCSWFCDPNQSQLVQIIGTQPYINPETSQEMVALDRLRYFITTTTASRIYTTCKIVHDSITGGIGIIYICGKANCNQTEFFITLGDNDYVDIVMEYVIDDAPAVDYVVPLSDEEIADCTDIVNGKSCVCNDCEAKVCEELVVEANTTWHYTLPTGLVLSLLLILIIFICTCLHKSPTVPEKVHIQVEGEVNRAVDVNSPLPKIKETQASSPPLKDSATALPSSTSTTSPLPQQNGEQKSLIRDKTPFYRCWLIYGPQLGEKWANIVYNYRMIIIFICLVLAGICCGGWYNFKITTDPVELWTSHSSISRQNKIDFGNLFGTTYRTAQLVVQQTAPTSFTDEDKVANGVFSQDVLKQVYDMMDAVQKLKGGDRSYTDLCYKPLGEFNTTHPLEDCATLSVFQWIDNDKTILDDPALYLDRFELCADAAMLPACLSSFRGPSPANIVLGGYNVDASNYLQATTLMVTFPLDGSSEKLPDILLWETSMKEYLLEQKDQRKDLFIAFSSDRALEDEIDRASHADIFTIVLSYILMFVYVGLTLGDIDFSFKGCLLNSKALLGIGGVVIVLISVISALGVTSYAGLPTTLIVIEVIPFLILAVGVDNVYIMVQGIQRSLRDRIARSESVDVADVKGILAKTMREVFPSMILSSLCQMVAFALGSLSFMPSVQNFAYNATIALLINFMLQNTLLLILLRFDLHRQLSRRLDVVCCIKAGKQKQPERGPTRWFIEEYWTKFMFRSKWVPAIILAIFGCFAIANVMLIPDLNLGLDAISALPTDSYLRQYFEIAYEDYRIGPGVSFVFKPKNGEYLDIYDDNIYSQLISSDTSLLKTIAKYGDMTSKQFIKGTGGSFMRTYNESWLDSSSCCWNNAESFCPSIEDRTDCSECPQDTMSTATKYQYLKWFLSDIPRTDGSGCSAGGAVSYSNSALFKLNSNNDTLGVTAGHFTSSHGTLQSSADFITARHQALELADEVNKNNPDIHVYAYGSFYHFYEQYDTIVRELTINVVVCVLATFFVAMALLGFHIYPSLCILLSVSMCTIDMIGSMVYLDIPLNAISLVNLLMSVGIAVEFSAHIVQAFTTSTEQTRLNKSRDALWRTGPAIISGIALTNFVGVIVLAAAKSQLFVIFYFRMFFTVNCLCVLHTVVFLPAFLAFLG